jgi:hypothetical protein
MWVLPSLQQLPSFAILVSCWSNALFRVFSQLPSSVVMLVSSAFFRLFTSFVDVPMIVVVILATAFAISVIADIFMCASLKTAKCIHF